MKKKAYLKDCRKMFKNNFTRFISIVLIIILGTAFFVGMNAVAPAMEDDAEKYMKENNIFDISLSSNLGYKEEDIEKFKEDADVKEIQGVFLYDVLTLYDKKDVTLRLFSSDKESDINKSKILDGRNIEKDNETLMSKRSLSTEASYGRIDTVGKNEMAIKKYDENQLSEDRMAEQLTLDNMDPFTGSKK